MQNLRKKAMGATPNKKRVGTEMEAQRWKEEEDSEARATSIEVESATAVQVERKSGVYPIVGDMETADVLQEERDSA